MMKDNSIIYLQDGDSDGSKQESIILPFPILGFEESQISNTTDFGIPKKPKIIEAEITKWIEPENIVNWTDKSRVYVINRDDGYVIQCKFKNTK